jgi:hypothetical protein
MRPGTNPMADGMAFVLQGVGPTALGPPGGGLGYGSDTVGAGGGLPHSVAIKFDVFDNAGEGFNSTGIFTGGRSPTVRDPSLSPDFPDTSISLNGTGIDLTSTHPFTVTLAYDGATLTETITDAVTNASKVLTFAVNIPALVGSDVAYVGFTGGTGGLTTVADVQSWTFQTLLPARALQTTVSGTTTTDSTSALASAEFTPITQEAAALWTFPTASGAGYLVPAEDQTAVSSPTVPPSPAGDSDAAHNVFFAKRKDREDSQDLLGRDRGRGAKGIRPAARRG